MAYITVQQAAAQWHCAADWLERLCQSGRLPGAVERADGWYIPADTTPPPHTAHLPMPLMNTAFVPGHCLDTVEAIADEHLRNIALAEFYYFSGHAEEAACAAELYLSHPDAALRLSACLIYAYANLTLGQPHRVRRALEQVRASLDDPAVAASPGLHAAAVFIVTTAAVLLHLPPLADADDLRDTLRHLPPGLRQFALYVQAHHTYLQGDYAKSLGIVETALSIEPDTYPIPAIYLHLVAVMNAVTQKNLSLAEHHLLAAWNIAQPDDLIEGFGEHHGLLGGMLEAVIKPRWPDDFKRIIDITYRFSAGWRQVHNPITGEDVADNLSTTEFSICMLATHGWTNQEIADHLSLSLYTVKSHLSKAFRKLGIQYRKDLDRYMLR